MEAVVRRENLMAAYRRVEQNGGAAGTIILNNATLNTGGLIAGMACMTGAGTINTNGLVSDLNLAFDDGHGLQQTFAFNSLPGQNILVNLNLSNPVVDGSLGAGYAGSASLRIADGVSVSSNNGYLGYLPGSTGVATVVGTGTTWAIHSTLYLGYQSGASGTCNLQSGTLSAQYGYEQIGYAGSGSFTQTGGANAAGGTVYLGYEPGSSGTYNLQAGTLSAVRECVGS
jgi:T5SS/PEP-CTERM-associated repeat protein